MKVTEHFAKAKGKTLVSFEVLPPLTVESGQLTGNGRPRRQFILAAHADFVNG